MIRRLAREERRATIAARIDVPLLPDRSMPDSSGRASSDPSHLLAWRTRLADMIEELASTKVSEQ